jgi:cytoplasmic iron level regulating protein YaaA (DUF328/UPF0246 family)
VTPRLTLLVPPSLSKATGGEYVASRGVFDEELALVRAQVRDALRERLDTASSRELEKVFGARGELLVRARDATRAVLANEAPLLPAWQRYDGVVWRHLDASSLSSTLRQRIVVPSGLYGLVAGEDFIADYRLSMNVRLPPLAPMANFWRPAITRALCHYTNDGPLVSLLPREHASSIDFAELERQRKVVHVDFVSADQRRAVGHDAKAVKGILARHLLTHGLGSLNSFVWRGWRVRRSGQAVIVTAPA